VHAVKKTSAAIIDTLTGNRRANTLSRTGLKNKKRMAVILCLGVNHRSAVIEVFCRQGYYPAVFYGGACEPENGLMDQSRSTLCPVFGSFQGK